MDLEEHARLLGRIVGNLHSLEFALRAYLYAKADPPHSPIPAGQSLTSLKVGDTVTLNAMTDYSSLAQLIDRYNGLVQQTHPHLVVDKSVVYLRDALAHGRVSAPDPTAALTLLKFEKPVAGVAKVSYSEKLTEKWLKDQATHVRAQIDRLAQAPGSPILPGP